MNILRKSNTRNSSKTLADTTHTSRDYADGSMTLVAISTDCKHDYQIELSVEDVKRIAEHYNQSQHWSAS